MELVYPWYRRKSFEKTDFKLGKLGIYYVSDVFGAKLCGGSRADKKFPDGANAAGRKHAERIC